MTTLFVRYAILLLTLITMTMLLANSVLFNFTVICMKPENRHWENTVANDTRYYSSSEEGFIIAAPSVGLVIGTLPAMFLREQLGLRLSFTFFGWLSGLATAVYPIFASNIPIALIARFTQGFGMAAAFVAIGVVPIEYGGDKLRALFLAVLTCSYQIGPFLTIPASAVFCSSSFGWHGVYYLFGAVTIFVFTIFLVFYRNSAHKVRFISSVKVIPQLQTIEDGLPEKFDLPKKPKLKLKLKKKTQPAPYGSLISSLSVWGVLISSIGDSLAFLVFYLYGPIYVNKVLRFEVGDTGVMAAIPYVGGIGSKFLAGLIMYKSEFLKSSLGILSSTAVYKTVITINFFLLTVLAPEYPIASEVILTVTSAVIGFHFMGLMSAAQVISKQYTYIISSAIAALESVVGLILPPFVSYMAPNHSAEEWKIVLYYVVGVLALTNVLFLAMTKVRPAKWTNEEILSNSTDLDKF
ncbi:hypothetical protein L596_029148 [Steinernema carpocapsae]|uniref:Major facilitator superfamily (MFS) profile domain-containing protein n=1 Tax=Steinernema carpocapsae TaxID=34508 RepID=A0A4U5LTT0_STECR|nr:hypothetical protein L596_029148 [Steinernema carpocapsae]